jgi:hypothetical protein
MRGHRQIVNGSKTASISSSISSIRAQIVEIRKPHRRGRVGWRWLELAAVGWL